MTLTESSRSGNNKQTPETTYFYYATRKIAAAAAAFSNGFAELLGNGAHLKKIKTFAPREELNK